MPDAAAERIATEVHARATAISELREITTEQSQSIDRIVVALDHLVGAIEARPTRGWLWRLLTVIGIVILVLNGFMFGILVSNQNYLKNCTTPSTKSDTHGCYEEGQARTGAVVQQIIQSNIYTAACSVQNVPDPNVRKIEACVREALAQVSLLQAECVAEGVEVAKLPECVAEKLDAADAVVEAGSGD